MKLTGRQRDILMNLAELQRRNGGQPIHYSDLAEKLGISNSAAYHMLQVLVEKDCVSLRFHLSEARIGRTSVIFEISDAGRQVLVANKKA